MKPQERFLIQKPKQGSSVETVIRNKCLFLFAMLDALLLLVTWSPSSTLMMKGQPLKSVTVRASKQRGETVGWCQGTKVSGLISKMVLWLNFTSCNNMSRNPQSSNYCIYRIKTLYCIYKNKIRQSFWLCWAKGQIIHAIVIGIHYLSH